MKKIGLAVAAGLVVLFGALPQVGMASDAEGGPIPAADLPPTVAVAEPTAVPSFGRVSDQPASTS